MQYEHLNREIERETFEHTLLDYKLHLSAEQIMTQYTESIYLILCQLA
jgi:hypothetical protein